MSVRASEYRDEVRRPFMVSDTQKLDAQESDNTRYKTGPAIEAFIHGILPPAGFSSFFGWYHLSASTRARPLTLEMKDVGNGCLFKWLSSHSEC